LILTKVPERTLSHPLFQQIQKALSLLKTKFVKLKKNILSMILMTGSYP